MVLFACYKEPEDTIETTNKFISSLLPCFPNLSDSKDEITKILEYVIEEKKNFIVYRTKNSPIHFNQIRFKQFFTIDYILDFNNNKYKYPFVNEVTLNARDDVIKNILQDEEYNSLLWSLLSEMDEEFQSSFIEHFYSSFNKQQVFITHLVPSSNTYFLKSLTNIQELIVSENALKQLFLPEKMEKLEYLHVSRNYQLKQLFLPKKMEKLEYLHVSRNYQLKQLFLPEKMEKLEYVEIYWNYQLEELFLPKKMESIKQLKIYGNDQFKELSLLEKMEKLEQLEIYRNDQLKELSLPKEMESIKQLEISWNYQLEKLSLPRKMNIIVEDYFSDNLLSFPSLKTVSVYKSSLTDKITSLLNKLNKKGVKIHFLDCDDNSNNV